MRKVYVEEGSAIARELYLAITLDRAAEKLAIIASTEGGMEIEEVARGTPEKILTVHVDPNLGPPGSPRAAGGLRPRTRPSKPMRAARGVPRRACTGSSSRRTPRSSEINPLVVTEAGDLVALDGKLNFDDNALYRHPDVAAMLDPDEEDPRELEAKKDRPRLRRPRRRHRLHGERRGPRDGDARHDPGVRRASPRTSSTRAAVRTRRR